MAIEVAITIELEVEKIFLWVILRLLFNAHLHMIILSTNMIPRYSSHLTGF